MAATLWQSIPIHGNGGHLEASCLTVKPYCLNYVMSFMDEASDQIKRFHTL